MSVGPLSGPAARTRRRRNIATQVIGATIDALARGVVRDDAGRRYADVRRGPRGPSLVAVVCRVGRARTSPAWPVRTLPAAPRDAASLECLAQAGFSSTTYCSRSSAIFSSGSSSSRRSTPLASRCTARSGCGTAGDYLLGRLSLWAYVDAPSHKRATYPRCVAPETSSVKAARLATTVRDVARGRAGAAAGFSLSTFRRRSECVAATLLETRERVATPAPEARSPVHSP